MTAELLALIAAHVVFAAVAFRMLMPSAAQKSPVTRH